MQISDVIPQIFGLRDIQLSVKWGRVAAIYETFHSIHIILYKYNTYNPTLRIKIFIFVFFFLCLFSFVSCPF